MHLECPAFGQSLHERVARLVLQVQVLADELVEVRTQYPVVLSRLDAVVGGVEVGDQPEGRTPDRVELLGLVGADGHVEGAGVAADGEVPVPEVVEEGDFGEGDDLEGLLVDVAPDVVLEVVAGEEGLQLLGQSPESQRYASLARVNTTVLGGLKALADDALFLGEFAVSELVEEEEEVVFEEGMVDDGLALELGEGGEVEE